MTDLKDVIKKAKKWAIDEIDKYDGPPSILNLETSIRKGQELAKKLKVDQDIVIIGCILMDIKLAECKSQGKRTEHCSIGAEATCEFLKQFKLDDKIQNRIVACVNEHHGTNKFTCIESEICANADCYRFILPKNVLDNFHVKARSGASLEESINFIEEKLDEKWGILSLDICKEELEDYYHMFKKLIKQSRESNI